MRHQAGDYKPCSLGFQSTHPHGVRLSLNRMDLCQIRFNPRTHMGCDRRRLWVSHQFSISFNPRTHMGCDALDLNALSVIDVSIHAPTWGATCLRRSERGWLPVSIHAPTWGATKQHQAEAAGYYVSIHAPTWGATNLWTNILRTTMFQSTHPHGVRHADLLV